VCALLRPIWGYCNRQALINALHDTVCYLYTKRVHFPALALRQQGDEAAVGRLWDEFKGFAQKDHLRGIVPILPGFEVQFVALVCTALLWALLPFLSRPLSPSSHGHCLCLNSSCRC
jgi:hypothetical protein